MTGVSADKKTRIPRLAAARYALYQFRYGYRTVRAWGSLNGSQWRPGDEIRDLQSRKLRALIGHVYRHVPYYRRIMKENDLHPGDIRDIRDLRHFPVLTKSVVRENFGQLLSDDISRRNVVKGSTGGSTGEPMIFYRDADSIVAAEAALLRGRSFAGYGIGDKFVYFMTSGRPGLMGKARAQLINLSHFPALNEEEELLRCMAKVKLLMPFCIESYASNLYRLARLCEKRGIRDIRIPVAFSTGEMLYDYQRELIERQFGGRVFDYYGCNEIGSLAYECGHHSRHITEEHVIVETTDADGAPVAGAYGDITITDLDNFAMPFVRYKNDDIGIISDEQCGCGRGLRILKSLEGRAQDFLKTKNGGLVPAIFFPCRFRGLKGLGQYQIIQTDLENITLRIVKNRFFTAGELDDMINAIKEQVGREVNVKVEEHDRIPLTGRGKHRLVISQIPTRF